MYFFLFLLFPLVFTYCVYSDFKTKGGWFFLKNRILISLFGLVCGAFLVTILEFVIFIPDYYGSNPVLYVLLHWCISFFIPSLFYVLYVLWATDSMEQRIQTFLYFELPFHMVFVPFICFSNASRTAFIFLFIIPLLFAFMVFAVKQEYFKLCELLFVNRGKAVFYGFLIFTESLIPLIVQALWYYDVNFSVWLLLSALYVAFCIVRGKLDIKSVIDAVLELKR